jgi:L-alanine-DL-glutamate epimerase-like enolase superfamily enzyme
MVEYCTGAPYVDDITTAGWALDSNGELDIPNRPGLGIELDPIKIEKYTQGSNFLSPV